MSGRNFNKSLMFASSFLDLQMFFELINQMKNIIIFTQKNMRKFVNLSKMRFCALKKPEIIQSEAQLNDFPQTKQTFNIHIAEVNEGDLKGALSNRLKKKYLSVCQESHEQIKKQGKFNGVHYGQGFRMFITIPTRLNIHSPYLYVHYLLDSSSPFTTLTHQALCALHGKKYSVNRTFNPGTYSIGPTNIEVHLSKPHLGVKNSIHRNVNVLGRNFYRQFKKAQIIENIEEEHFEMIVSK